MSQAPGILDSRSYSQGCSVFTHNPYWYEGFSLSPKSVPSYSFNTSYGCKVVEQAPYSWGPQRWNGPARHVKPLRTTNLRNYVVEESQRRGGKPFSPPMSESASEHTLGYSDSERSDRDIEERDSQLEAKLVQCIVDYFGDCKGSLPSERVQNVIKKDYADLYEAVVVARFRKKWHKFLQHCSETFHLFTRPAQPAPNQDYCWRIRLVNNMEWEEADQQDEEFRAKRDKELLDKVHNILVNSPGKQCLMIDVINEMNKDAKGDDGKDDELRKARKIRAGDLKRLMRKCNSNFTIVEFQEEDAQKRATFMKLVEPAVAA